MKTNDKKPTSQSISEKLMGGIKEMTEAMHPGSTTPQEQHTPGEIKISPKPIHRNTQGNAWVKYIINQPPLNARTIAKVYGNTQQEAEANAERFNNAWNEHDKLKADNERMLEAIRKFTNENEKYYLMKATREFEIILAQAEEGWDE